jgi:predicted nucleotidyltransferase
MQMFDLAPQHLTTLLELIKRYAPGAEVWAYGSRVTGGAHEASDVDLVLRNPADLTQAQVHLPELKAAIAESNLPVLVDVMDWARVPDEFRREMERMHVVLGDSLPVEAGKNKSICG